MVNVGALGFPEVINEAFQRQRVNNQIGEMREKLAEQEMELQRAHIETREGEFLAATITPKS